MDVRTLPQAVRKTMDKEGVHSKEERRDIMAAVYDQYTKACRSRYLRNVDNVAADIAEQFPGFGKGMRLSDRLRLVRESLLNKFKNKRKSCESPEVQVRKKPRKELPNFLPDALHSDGMQVHESVLKMKNEVLDERQVQEAMGETLPDRRRMLAGANRARKSITRLKEKYPLLFSEDEMWEEFARLKGDARGGKAQQAEARQELLKVLDNVPGHNAVGLAASLKELEDICVEAPDGCYHPVIVTNDGRPAQLFIEGTECVALKGDAEDQLLAWAISFSVFSQKLTFNAVKNTATFLAMYIVKSDSCNKLPKGLQVVIKKLFPNI